jgi:hypothetical protein
MPRGLLYQLDVMPPGGQLPEYGEVMAYVVGILDGE